MNREIKERCLSRKDYLKKDNSNVGYALYVQDNIRKDDYVRLNTGEIVKVIGIKENNVNKKAIYYGFYDTDWFDSSAVENFSEKIIDLIKPGDLVRIFVEENVDENGTTEDTCLYEVTTTQVKDFYGNKLEEIGIVGEDGPELIPFANVRGIVTKEKFASMEYKVKE